MDTKTHAPHPRADRRPVTRRTARGPVEYLEFGEGPVVVALHGAMGGYDQSAILADTVLAGNFRVLALSRPGYLGTPLSSGVSPAQQADLVASLLDSLEIGSAHVVAISGGGPCAISFALEYPRRCASLVLVSTVSGINTVSIPFSFRLLKLLARIPFVVSAMRKKALENLERTAARSISSPAVLRRMLADAESRALFKALMASTFERMAERLSGTDNDIRITQSTEYPLQDIQAPTLIVHGDSDPLVSYQTHAKSAQARIPGAELLTLEGGEHVAIFTHRDAVRDKVTRFLEQREAASAA